MKTLRIRPSLLALALNWIAFAGVFAWISTTQHNALWWLRLGWSNWLTELGALASLGKVATGSLWILWLTVSAVWTLAFALLTVRRPISQEIPPLRREPDVQAEAETEPAMEPAPPAVSQGTQWQLTPDDPVLVAHAGLREKIQRLSQSLNQI